MPLRTIVAVILSCAVVPIPVSLHAEDCDLPTPAFRRSGVLDPDVWLCPVRLTSNGTPATGPILPMGVPTYFLGEVLDERACPASLVRALFIPSVFDAVPALTEGQTMLFIIPPISQDYRATAEAEGLSEPAEGTLDIRADADSCAGLRGWGSLGEHWDAFGSDVGVSDELLALRPADSEDMAWALAHGLPDIEYLLVPDSSLWFARDTTDPVEPMSWGQILERRTLDPLSRGENAPYQEDACQSTERPTSYSCQFDSDCDVCHDGSDCGTIQHLDRVLLEGVDCQIPDSAECEMSAPRCCEGRCVRASF